MPNRPELAAFLRARRARLRPAEVGLPEAGPRRTPGLRRQEVAQLAGISVEYYIRMEQARGPQPSPQVLAALARALLLSADEREYLYRTADRRPPVVTGPDRSVSPAVRALLDGMAALPAYVVDAGYELLAWNTASRPFLGDPARMPEGNRNMVRWIFTRPDDDPHWSEPDTRAFAAATVADLRAAYARYPGNPALTALVAELSAAAPRFAALWAEHHVEVRRTHHKRVRHPELGDLEFDCQVLHIADTDQRIIAYCPEPGSPTAVVFARLAELTAAR